MGLLLEEFHAQGYNFVFKTTSDFLCTKWKEYSSSVHISVFSQQRDRGFCTEF